MFDTAIVYLHFFILHSSASMFTDTMSSPNCSHALNEKTHFIAVKFFRCSLNFKDASVNDVMLIAIVEEKVVKE